MLDWNCNQLLAWSFCTSLAIWSDSGGLHQLWRLRRDDDGSATDVDGCTSERLDIRVGRLDARSCIE